MERARAPIATLLPLGSAGSGPLGSISLTMCPILCCFPTQRFPLRGASRSKVRSRCRPQLSPQRWTPNQAGGRRVVSRVPCFSEWQHPRATNPRKAPESGRVRPQRRAAEKRPTRARRVASPVSPVSYPTHTHCCCSCSKPSTHAATAPARGGALTARRSRGASARRGTRPCRRRAAARACPGSRPCPWCASVLPRARRRATRGEPARRARARPGARGARACSLHRPARGGRPAGPGRTRHLQER